MELADEDRPVSPSFQTPAEMTKVASEVATEEVKEEEQELE